MSIGPFDVSPVTDRIKTQVTALREVETSAALDAALKSANSAVVPAAYVFLAAERAGAAKGASGGVTIQQVDVTIGVLIHARNYRVADLTAAVASLHSTVSAVRTAVIGWMPTNAQRGLQLQAGRLEKFAAGDAWWQELYTTHYRIEAQP